MREPGFWRTTSRWSRGSAPVTRLLLTPVSALYAWIGARKIAQAAPYDCGVPVICIGNLTVGGVGKTPLTLFLRNYIEDRFGLRTATLSRGYGGTLKGTVRVDALANTASEVGDEPLMMAGSGESWIGADRVAAARRMVEAGVQVILMDDGFQNPGLKKTFSIVAIDASNPFGNGFIFPKGPLREPVAAGLDRADMVVMMGDGDVPASVLESGIAVLRAHVRPDAAPPPGRYIGFAGIGNPLKFFDTLNEFEGVELPETVPYPDHYPYTNSDLSYLRSLAQLRDATLITTEKDYARMSPEHREGLLFLPVAAHFNQPGDMEKLDDALATALKQHPQ
ncbi:MAG: tetraacyldisaccharide 4'-kinase [Hirschia sp.]|nr:tetraacyldisaccharide 4'-kinase [Hirschia sp.]|tara:strand:- start:389 stop:1396 length:1008 start_codon:yes stop_codon:yes gene_type:complete